MKSDYEHMYESLELLSERKNTELLVRKFGNFEIELQDGNQRIFAKIKKGHICITFYSNEERPELEKLGYSLVENAIFKMLNVRFAYHKRFEITEPIEKPDITQIVDNFENLGSITKSLIRSFEYIVLQHNDDWDLLIREDVIIFVSDFRNPVGDFTDLGFTKEQDTWILKRGK